MDSVIAQIGREMSRSGCTATELPTKKKGPRTPDFIRGYADMDEECNNLSFIIWPPIPHMPHEV